MQYSLRAIFGLSKLVKQLARRINRWTNHNPDGVAGTIILSAVGLSVLAMCAGYILLPDPVMSILVGLAMFEVALIGWAVLETVISLFGSNN